MTSKPLAFIIMPFDEEVDDVYEHFMKPLLEEVGFDADRADDIDSQQNILRDILERIDQSELIIADLTNGNPNVFYELGLAHALRKPVILLTQDIEEVPFDLKSYRLLEYSTHFHKIRNAREPLTRYAEEFLKKNIQFGSPVTDFLPEEAISKNLRDGSEPADNDRTNGSSIDDALTNVEEDDRGFLDHLIAINEGYNRIAEITERVTVDLEGMTQSTNVTTEEFARINANPNASSPAAARNASRKLATQIGSFASRLKEANSEYSEIAQDTEDSLEFVVSFQQSQSDEKDPAIVEQLESLLSLQSAVTTGRDSFLGLADIMDGLPRLERRLNREVTRASGEIRVMASNLDRTIASISRALRDQA